MVRRKVEDQNTKGGSTDEGEVAGTKQANLEHTAPQNTALARRVAGLGGEEDSSQKACPPAQPQWGAISGEGGSTQYVLAQLMSPNQDVASQRGGAKTKACGEQD